MANPLGINLKAGDKLVMANGAEVEVSKSLLFGAMTFTSGTALGVVHGGREVKTDSYDIDAEKTRERFGEVNGWNKKEPTSA